ncbi:hypothetical protein ANCCAN_24039 [Ancylostoma caninum]|uniref:C2H2-type domain-containing protein n=1 Tax=Ancylostoma caninum TaxID=29170 RepID=A0A368FDE7_ANCCA|nr:hypothetical protein ANCCAN_24039 [Ancylostoma caninum]
MNQPEPTPYYLAKHAVREIDVSKLLGSESTVKEFVYNGANASEREDENGFDEVITCTPAGNRMGESTVAKSIPGQKASKRIGDMIAFTSANTQDEYVGSTLMKATNTRKRKSSSSNNENKTEKKDGAGNMLEGCGQKIQWRPRYGKDRILNHVRTHWGKPTKKCKLCDFKATHARKVLSHHKVAHASEKYEMAESLERKEDLEQLELLWRECFPAWFA